MRLFGFAFGVLELVLLAAFILGLVIAVSFDRRGMDEPKWLVFAGGLAVLGFMTWSDWTFAGLGAFLLSSAFWIPVAKYLGAGLVYSIVEFVREVRNSAAYLKTRWENNLTEKARTVYPDVLEKAGRGLKSEHFDYIRDVVTQFVDRNHSTARVVGVARSEDYIKVEPKINKSQLADHISAWTFLWPAYAISLLLGDFLTEVFRLIAEFYASIAGRFVRMSFKDVFKF